ncbi:MAG TPA: PAS domain S-box protein [Actinomycetes bacterium]|nr:PAS domain S-box protein [Actinomycetes bacterium]
MRTKARQRGRRQWRRGTAGALRSEALVEEAAAPACVLDRNGRILVANRALEGLIGASTAGGLRGRTLPSLAYPPDEELANAAVQQVLEEGLDRCQVEARWVRVFSRELVWGAFDLSLVRDRRGRPELAIAMVRDLTEIKRSDHERRFFEFMFKLIGEADSSHQVLAAAVQTICHFTRCAMGQVWLPAGGVLVCSPSWYCNGYGFEKLHEASEAVTYELGEGLPGLAWAKGQPMALDDIRDSGRFDRALPAQRAGVREAMAVPVTGGDGVVAVLELFVTHERAGEPGRLERIARVAEELGPLVERRRAAEALAASQEQFAAVTDAAVDAIVSADSSGRVLTWNRGAERLFGWTSAEMVGRPLTVIIPERFRALHSDGIARVRRTGSSKLAGKVVELAGLRRDGSELPIELSVGTWSGADGMAFSGVLRDITERKRAEAELAATNKELERANAELETLVYSASHDLKSPMVSLLGYLEYLRLDFGEVLGPEGNRYLNRMADSTMYMQQLIHDLIDLSRVGRSGVEPIEVDLGRLVRAIAEDAGAANPATEIRVGRLPVVTGDPTGFRQLFTNLLENAIRHGGRPDLVVVVDGRDRPDGAVELSVRDNGKGIPPDHRERVFGVFERLEGPSTGEGTGMGLAICRKIVEVLGGAIAIVGDRGTDVRILLPRAAGARWPTQELTAGASR